MRSEPPVHSGGRSAATRATQASPTTRPARGARRRTALTPAPMSSARPRTTSGTIRSTDRSARPTVPADARTSKVPNNDGWAYG